MSHLWWRLETTSAETRSSLLWVLSTSGVTLFLIGIVALAGTPTGLASVVYASLGLIGIAALLGADRHGMLDGRWLASRAAAWFFSIACVFATATLVFTLIEWRSGFGTRNRLDGGRHRRVRNPLEPTAQSHPDECPMVSCSGSGPTH